MFFAENLYTCTLVMSRDIFSIVFIFSVITMVLLHGIVDTLIVDEKGCLQVELLEENIEEEVKESKSDKDLEELLEIGHEASNLKKYPTTVYKNRLSELSGSTIFQSFNYREVHSPPPECLL
jgi:hypothetical protein